MVDLNKVLESEKTAQNATERATEAFKAREQAEKISAMTAEQAETIKIQLQEMNSKAEQSDSYKSEVDILQKQVSDLKAKLASAEQSAQTTAEKVKQERKDTEERYKHDIEVAVKVAVADTKEQYQARIEEIQKEHARQIAELLAQQSKTITKKKL